MATHSIADFFPQHWVYGEYERRIFAGIVQQVNTAWPNQINLVLNTTWCGPQTLDAIDARCQQHACIDNLFLVSTVDPAMASEIDPLLQRIRQHSTVGQVHKLGNFDSKNEFNFFAVVCGDHFRSYNTDDLILRDIQHRYVCYNRKPYPHRLALVQALKQHNLLDHGIVTLGRAFPDEPDHGLYMTIGEQNSDYVEWGHWYDQGGTSHDIPHDLFSLHNWSVWQHHFLHVVGTTAPYNIPDTFANQITFKPVVGMRPFLINGQTKQYQYLRRHGFRTFEHWFPVKNLDADTSTPVLAQALIQAIKWVCAQPVQQLQSMYDAMLPDLLHNRQRWQEWTQEQKHLVNNLFQ